MLQQISARQLTEWMAFYSIDPWGVRRADLRNGMIGALLSQMQGRDRPVTDFLMFDEATREQDKQQRERAKIANMRGWFEKRAKADAEKHKRG